MWRSSSASSVSASAALRGSLRALLIATVMAPAAATAQQTSNAAPASGAVTLPEIRVIATTPVAPPRPPPRPPAATVAPARNAAPSSSTPAPAEPGVIDRDKVPSNVQTISATDFDPAKAPSLLDWLERGLPGVSLGDQTGNQFQHDLNYRGFVASPVIGTPQGLAVYQNGVRINEVFGDIVNWDFIPQNADQPAHAGSQQSDLRPQRHRRRALVRDEERVHLSRCRRRGHGRRVGRAGASLQAGGQVGNLSGYITADAIDDAGWRQNSPSQLRRIYADLGARGDQTEFHVTFTGASNGFGATAATPVEMLNQNWSSTYTVPQTTGNQLAFLTASASWKPTDTWTYQANAYFRSFRQNHVDGNGTDAQNTGCPDPAVLCFPNLDGSLSNLITTSGQTVAATGALGTSVLGEIDRTWTATNLFGGSGQAATSERIFGQNNNFVAGLSIDRGLVQFSSTSELGTINANQFPVVQGTGLFIDQPSGDLAPVGLGAQTLYAGLYATDTLDVTSRLSVTAGGRFNFAQINLQDELGNDALLNGNHSYSRFNPTAGATYKVTPNITVYGGYSEANRAPTPLELACSDPLRPCLIDSALVGDPTLKQVVSHTFEAGVRGHYDIAKGPLNWSVGVYHALNTDDIINVASPIIGHQFFQNGGNTLRQGIEAQASYKWDRWNVYANFTSVDATFQNALTLSSPFNPFANPLTGNHQCPSRRSSARHPGFPIQARRRIPHHRSVEIRHRSQRHRQPVSGRRRIKPEPKIPAYWTVNLHSSYQVSKRRGVRAGAQPVQPALLRYGTFFDTGLVSAI